MITVVKKHHKHRKITSYELELFRGIADCKYGKLLETYTKYHFGLEIVPQIIDPVRVAHKAVLDHAYTHLHMSSEQAIKRADEVADLYWEQKEQQTTKK